MSQIPNLLPLREVLRRVPYSRTQLWRLERAGGFPRRLRLGGNRVAWVEDEVVAWVAERAKAREGGDA